MDVEAAPAENIITRPLGIMATTQGHTTSCMVAMVMGTRTMAGLPCTLGTTAHTVQLVWKQTWSQCTIQTDPMQSVEDTLFNGMVGMVGNNITSCTSMADTS